MSHKSRELVFMFFGENATKEVAFPIPDIEPKIFEIRHDFLFLFFDPMD